MANFSDDTGCLNSRQSDDAARLESQVGTVIAFTYGVLGAMAFAPLTLDPTPGSHFGLVLVM